MLAVFAAAAGCAAAFPGVGAHSSESRDAAQSLYEVIAAEIAAHREQPEVALALLDQTLARTKSSEVGELAWRTALQTRNPDIVLEQARAWAEIDPKAGLARRTILVNAVEKGRQSEYVELLSRMYADAEDKAELITDVTTLLAQPETASAALETVLSPIGRSRRRTPGSSWPSASSARPAATFPAPAAQAEPPSGSRPTASPCSLRRPTSAGRPTGPERRAFSRTFWPDIPTPRP